MNKPEEFAQHLDPRRMQGRDWLMTIVGAVVAAAALFAITSLVVNNEPVPLKPKKDAAVSIQWLPETVKRWEDPINEMAKKYNIDPNVLAILITLESGGYSAAKS